MATKEDTKPQTVLPAYVEQKAESNLNAVYPLWFGGVDVRTAKEGYKAHPIHGLLLGIIDLPSQQIGEDGEPADWKAIVVELKQPALAKAPGEEEPRVYNKGDRIALTVTATLEKMVGFAENPYEVLEAQLKPEVKKNKRNQNMWIFPHFDKVAVHKRERSHSISAASVFSRMAPAPTAPAMGSAAESAPFGNNARA